MKWLAAFLLALALSFAFGQTSRVSGFMPDGVGHKGAPPTLAPGKVFAVYDRSEPNQNRTASVWTVLILAKDGTAAMHLFRKVGNKAMTGTTFYWYWKMTKEHNAQTPAALLLTEHKHSTMIGAEFLDKSQMMGILAPDGKTLKLIEAGEVNIYTRRFP